MSPRDLARTRKTYGSFRSPPIYEASAPGDTYIISGGVGSGGDVSASYILVTGTSSLPNSRALLAGTGLIGSDGGAGASYSLGINNAVVATVSGATFTGGVSVDSTHKSVAQKGSDVFFYVSGTVGGAAASSKKAAFGGDVVVSGSLQVGSGSVTIRSSSIEFSPTVTLEKSGSYLLYKNGTSPVADILGTKESISIDLTGLMSYSLDARECRESVIAFTGAPIPPSGYTYVNINDIATPADGHRFTFYNLSNTVIAINDQYREFYIDKLGIPSSFLWLDSNYPWLVPVSRSEPYYALNNDHAGTGDIIYWSAVGFQILPTGSVGQVLTVNSSSSSPIKWTSAHGYTLSFSQANLAGTVLPVTHSLGNKFNTVQVYNNSDTAVFGGTIRAKTDNTLEVDLSTYAPLTGSWVIVVR